MDRRHLITSGICGLAASALPRAARAAETATVALARGFAIPHLPVMIMEHEKLLEKHLAAAGLPGTSVSWSTIGSGVVMNDALLAGTLHVATGGVTPMLLLWSRTKGTPLEVRGICAEATMPNFLNTRDPAVQTLGDFGPRDRIAVGAIKTSIQAILLQMACAKTFGQAAYGKLDEITVGMNSVDATTAIRTPNNQVNSNFSIPPFQYEELKVSDVHRVLSSYEILGAPHTFSLAWTTSRFRNDNPQTFKALLAAIRDAMEIIRTDKQGSTRMYLDITGAKTGHDEILELLENPEIEFTMTPKATMVFADFMSRIGLIKVKPDAWTDYFFTDIHDLKGS